MFFFLYNNTKLAQCNSPHCTADNGGWSHHSTQADLLLVTASGDWRDLLKVSVFQHSQHHSFMVRKWGGPERSPRGEQRNEGEAPPCRGLPAAPSQRGSHAGRPHTSIHGLLNDTWGSSVTTQAAAFPERLLIWRLQARRPHGSRLRCSHRGGADWATSSPRPTWKDHNSERAAAQPALHLPFWPSLTDIDIPKHTFDSWELIDVALDSTGIQLLACTWGLTIHEALWELDPSWSPCIARPGRD